VCRLVCTTAERGRSKQKDVKYRLFLVADLAFNVLVGLGRVSRVIRLVGLLG
jgi:hypothetical protein